MTACFDQTNKFVLHEIFQYLSKIDIMIIKTINKQCNSFIRDKYKANKRFLFDNELDFWCNLFMSDDINRNIKFLKCKPNKYTVMANAYLLDNELNQLLKITDKKYEEKVSESVITCNILGHTFDIDLNEILNCVDKYVYDTIQRIIKGMHILLSNDVRPWKSPNEENKRLGYIYYNKEDFFRSPFEYIYEPSFTENYRNITNVITYCRGGYKDGKIYFNLI